jgi:CDP-diacylglycerol---glycerol-3-phosphate 3-phosphatidyltransferase
MTCKTGSPLERRYTCRQLHRNALRTGGEHVLGLLAVFLCILQLWPVKAALQWLVQTLVVLSFVHFRLHCHLGENHSPAGGEPASSLGVANRITLGRGWGISCLAGMIFLPGPMFSGGAIWVAYIPGLLYLAIGCADFIDGLWARRTGTESVLGRRLDVEMDALGMLAASALAAWLGRLPLFYLLVGASYYMFRFGIWYRGRRGRVVLPLKDRPTARILAGLNMGFLCAALLPVPAPQVLKLAAVCFSVPLLVGFLWDWFQVSARLTEDRADRLLRFIAPANGVLALVMRIVVLVSGPAIAETFFQSLPAMVALVGCLLWVMIVSGWMGRTASLAVSCWVTLTASSGDQPLLVLVTLCAVLVLTILGTGYWSWWKPEDACLSRKVGARSIP